jgi:hypothetical protein
VERKVKETSEPELEIINPGNSPDCCWCPMCAKHDQPRAFHWSIWAAPGGEVVCIYSLCAKCLDLMISASITRRVEFNDHIEVNLLRRYPQLRAKLFTEFRHSAN